VLVLNSEEKTRELPIKPLFFALTAIIILLGLILLILYLFPEDILPLGCKFERVCHISTAIDSPTFDCDIIYSRLEKYLKPGMVYGSIANINATACSDEVLSILEKQFNTTFNRSKCNYVCCITDGTCDRPGGIAINHQGYWWGG
jgi:hypothetical protein